MKKDIFTVLIALLIVCSIFSCAYATNNTPTNNGTIYVSLAGDDNNNGLTPETSKRTIASAIWAVKTGGTIHVKPGFYKENLVIWKDLNIIGENRENTIIDGGTGTCIVIHRDYGSNETCNITIEKFTIQNGAPCGIGIEGGGNSLLIKDTIITKNTGHGIYANYRSKVKIENSIITKNNAADIGGGIFADNNVLEISNSLISENSANEGGGILSVQSISKSVVIISNSNITGNRASDGGGLLKSGGTTSISGSLFTNNVASNAGGAIYSKRSSGDLNIVKTSITGNKAKYGGGIYKTDQSAHINESIIQNNSAIYGAGIFNINSMLYLEGLKITDNSARTGGGIYNAYHGTINIKNTEIQHNHAWYRGGGIYNEDLIYIDKITQIINNWRHNQDGQPIRNIETGEIIKI